MQILTENYKSSFMKLNPTLLGTFVNRLKQTIKFYEHPRNGDADFVYALIDGSILVQTDFFETDDMIQDHQEYTPFLVKGKVYSGYELF